LEVIEKIKANDDTVVIIEHNLDVIKSADYIIDLGPEGGNKGGNIIALGTPEEIADNPLSHTGKFLKKILG
jgi:excinuclease ABC subunit A